MTPLDTRAMRTLLTAMVATMGVRAVLICLSESLRTLVRFDPSVNRDGDRLDLARALDSLATKPATLRCDLAKPANTLDQASR